MEFESAKSESAKREEGASERRSRSRHLKVQFFFRLCAAAAALAAAVLMRLNQQTSVIVGFAIKASYESSPAFKFFVYGNGMAAAYMVASLPFVSCCVVKGSVIMHLSDLVCMILVIGVVSAAAAIGSVGQNGNDQTGWAKVCPYFEGFCKKTEVSVGCSFLAFLCLLSVCVLSFVCRSKLPRRSASN